jgi:hypothetical protein
MLPLLAFRLRRFPALSLFPGQTLAKYAAEGKLIHVHTNLDDHIGSSYNFDPWNSGGRLSGARSGTGMTAAISDSGGAKPVCRPERGADTV